MQSKVIEKFIIYCNINDFLLDDLVYLKCEKGKLQMNQDAKKKKRNIEKGSAPMIIRLVWNEKEIARLD